jgi:hypothetical protein
MKKYFLIVFVLVSLICFFNIGEANVDGADPSASNFHTLTGTAAVGKVNLQTGTPSFSMPILSVPVKGLPDLTLALSYKGDMVKHVKFNNNESTITYYRDRVIPYLLYKIKQVSNLVNL